jgi:predicted RNase H-like nuclease (RuvC/YqgF family)
VKKIFHFLQLAQLKEEKRQLHTEISKQRKEVERLEEQHQQTSSMYHTHSSLSVILSFI